MIKLLRLEFLKKYLLICIVLVFWLIVGAYWGTTTNVKVREKNLLEKKIQEKETELIIRNSEWQKYVVDKTELRRKIEKTGLKETRERPTIIKVKN